MKTLMMIAGLMLILGSCYNDKYDKLYPAISTTICDTTTITYTHDIAPIINANCAISGSHTATGTSGYDYSGSITVIQGNAANGALLSDINGTPTRGHNTMPLNLPRLSTCDVN